MPDAHARACMPDATGHWEIPMGVIGRVHNTYPDLYSATSWCLVDYIGC
jgi:hypothetical protein